MRVQAAVLSLGMFACSNAGKSDGELVAVEANTLGISSVEISHNGQGDERDLTITGTDDEGAMKAVVTMHTGRVYFEPDWSAPLWARGTDLTITVGDATYHRVTPDLDAHETTVEPVFASFVNLEAVATAIKDEAGIRFASHQATGEIALDAAACNGANFPTAKGNPTQCCQDGASQWFKIAQTGGTNGKLATRQLSPYGACRTSGGATGCTSDCTYGACGAEAWGATGTNAATVFTPTTSGFTNRCGYDDNGATAGGNSWPETYVSQTPKSGVTAACTYTQCLSNGTVGNVLTVTTTGSYNNGFFALASPYYWETNPYASTNYISLQNYMGSSNANVPGNQDIFIGAKPSTGGRLVQISGACSASSTSYAGCTIPANYAGDMSITVTYF